MEDKLIYAKDFKCSYEGCDKQSSVFFPCIDPDIPSHPYCREHADKLQMELLIEFSKVDKQFNTVHNIFKDL